MGVASEEGGEERVEVGGRGGGWWVGECGEEGVESVDIVLESGWIERWLR